MTGGDPNKAEIELDIGGDAVEQAKALAKALDDAADAEERLQKELAKRNRVTSGLASQKVREQAREQREAERTQRQSERRQQSQQRSQESHSKRAQQQQERDAVEAEQRKNRVVSGLGRQRVQEESRQRREWEQEQKRRDREAEQREARRRTSPEVEARRRTSPEVEARRRLSHMKREEAVQARLDAMTGRTQKTGLAGLQHAAEGKLGMKAGALNGVSSRLGGMAGPAAGMAAFAAAGKFGVDAVTTVNDQMQHGNPYADDFTRGREVVGNLPFSKEFFAASDVLTGRTQALAKMNRRQGVEDVSAGPRAEGYRQQLEQEREVRVARAASQNTRSYAVPGAPNVDRSTAKGEQQYRYEQRMLPLKERQAEAARATADAVEAHSAALEKVKKIEAERDRLGGESAGIYADIQGKVAANKGKLIWEKMPGEQGSVEYLEANRNLERNAKRMRELEQERTAAAHAAKGTATGLAKAKWNESQAGIATAAERYQDLREREQTSGDRAAALGMAGHQGRMQALNNLKRQQRYGVSGLPADVLQSNMQFAPEMTRKALEAEGAKSFETFREVARDDYRDDPKTIREQANKAQQDVQQQKQGANERQADDLLSAAERAGVVGGQSLGKAMVEAIKQSTEFIVAKAIEELEASGRLSGYNLPVQR